MKKNYIFILVIVIVVFVFVGCKDNSALNTDEEIAESINEVINDNADSSEDGNSFLFDDSKIDSKFESIDFYMVSGTYSRNVIQEDVEVLEMFAVENNSFVRVFTDDLEREVYAYNYINDNFTYLYYLDGELVSKTVINVDTGNIVKDEEGYADMLIEDALELKDYFYDLMDMAQLTVDDINN